MSSERNQNKISLMLPQMYFSTWYENLDQWNKVAKRSLL